jgi:endonuclease-3
VKRPRSTAAKQDNALKILRALKKHGTPTRVALDHSSPLQLLIATILSAQCTDERVNMVTAELFRKRRSVADFATVDPRELERDIHSTGFFRAKAKNIIACCQMLLERYGGEVPDTLEELTALPGVGRKTANVVLGNAFGKAEGIVVDTHVKRLAQRMGLSAHSDPEKIEADLMKIIPKKSWIETSSLLIWHGRKVCSARSPQCPECPVKDLCPSADTF